MFPLAFVVFVSAVKDILEDRKRHLSDNQENNRKVLVGTADGFQEKMWKEVKVGNVVKIKNNEYFPCDLILLNSSANKGICYIETKNLDGETNMKHKNSHKEVLNYCQYDNAVSKLQG